MEMSGYSIAGANAASTRANRAFPSAQIVDSYGITVIFRVTRRLNETDLAARQNLGFTLRGGAFPMVLGSAFWQQGRSRLLDRWVSEFQVGR